MKHEYVKNTCINCGLKRTMINNSLGVNGRWGWSWRYFYPSENENINLIKTEPKCKDNE